MGDKKTIYILIGLAVVLLISAMAGIFLYSKNPNTANEELIQDTNPVTDNTPGSLPTSDDTINDNSIFSAEELALKKEKQFISSFWQEHDSSFSPATTNYALPIGDIKQDITNYRDFSRRIDLDDSLDKLSQNGFIVLEDQFQDKVTDWESSYKSIKDSDVPIFITADSVIGLYQNTMHIVYKEIEEEIFYPSLWSLLEEMHSKVEQRYNLRYAKFGIENDLVTEANRLELAYLTTALQLMKPDEGQIKESIGTDSKFFSTAEAETYKITVPEYLENEIKTEIENISNRRNNSYSPIFLYNKDYKNFTIPEQYSTSEKLKNYYLAITWLNESLFPLWSSLDNCEDCYLDKNDQQINFVATLLLSNDLAKDQALKNQWANIYKSISFFKGLETNLTYLDYQRALIEEFGENYILEDLFNDGDDEVTKRISSLQNRINSYEFPISLGGDKIDKKETGLRLLRNYHLLENKLFDSLTGPETGGYELELTQGQKNPFTICANQDDSTRCTASGLDLFSLLGNVEAKNILEETSNTQYQNYNKVLNNFIQEMNTFDQNTWHDNAYMSMLASLQATDQAKEGVPAFMTTAAWQKKSLNTNLAAWTDFHREINFEKTSLKESSGLGGYFPYGYIEPQIDLYGELLSNINMIIDGFTTLEIMSNNSKSYERLENLRIMLNEVFTISKKELQNEELESRQYNFINSFNKQIRSFIGDIKKENLQNRFSFTSKFSDQASITQSIDGLSYIVVIYPNTNGELFFAIGPIFDYQEKNRQNTKVSDWQDEYKVN